MKRIILSLTLVTLTNQALTIDYTALALLVHQYDALQAPRSNVAFIKNAQGTKYVVKQYNKKTWNGRLASTVCELIALEIGNNVGIALDTAWIIPAGVDFIGKDLNMPATLHTFVDGIRFDKYKGIYSGIYIRQQSPEHKVLGLTKDIIYHMSRHRDLPGLVAFDTFVGNADRARVNYFYHEDTDTFTGIDMGSAFRRDLCKLTARNLRGFMEDPALSFSEQEIVALTEFKQVLQKLMARYSAHDICIAVDACAQESGLFNKAYFSTTEQKRWASYLSHSKRVIRQSCNGALQLVETLDELLKKLNH